MTDTETGTVEPEFVFMGEIRYLVVKPAGTLQNLDDMDICESAPEHRMGDIPNRNQEMETSHRPPIHVRER